MRKTAAKNTARRGDAALEAEERRLALRVVLVEQGFSLAKVAIWVFCVCFVAHGLFSMLSDVAHAKEGTVYALAALVEKLSVDRILMAAGNVVFCAAWQRSRLRNKRLTKKLGEFRHAVESGDLVCTRSGLDKFGKLMEDTQ